MVRLLALAALLAAAPASAAGAAALDEPGLMTPSVVDALAKIKAAEPKWAAVDMTVEGYPNLVELDEPSLGLHVRGSGSLGAGWFSGTAGDGGSLSFTADRFGGGWSLFGSGISVTLTPFGEGYSVWGSVDGQSLNCTISRFGSSLSISGQNGASLEVWGWGTNLSVRGRIDETRFNRKALAVLGAALGLSAPLN